MEEKRYKTIQKIGEIPTGFGRVSLNKKKEKICGDYYTVITDQDSTVLVLSDGLGSGVKANILATLPAQMLSIMIARNMDIQTAVKAVVSVIWPMLHLRCWWQKARKSVCCSMIIRMLFCCGTEKMWNIKGRSLSSERKRSIRVICGFRQEIC